MKPKENQVIAFKASKELKQFAENQGRKIDKSAGLYSRLLLIEDKKNKENKSGGSK